MPWLGFQSFFNVLTQISPAADTFGWKILVKNTPVWGAGVHRCTEKQLEEPRSAGREAQSVHTALTLWWGVWVVCAQDELEAEHATLERSPLCT